MWAVCLEFTGQHHCRHRKPPPDKSPNQDSILGGRRKRLRRLKASVEGCSLFPSATASSDQSRSDLLRVAKASQTLADALLRENQGSLTRGSSCGPSERCPHGSRSSLCAGWSSGSGTAQFQSSSCGWPSCSSCSCGGSCGLEVKIRTDGLTQRY